MTLNIKDLEMNTDLDLSELFDRYLENDLNFHERQEFELRIKVDLAFAERFRLHREVDKALIEVDIMNFRLQLEKLGNRNSALIEATPMVISEEIAPDNDHTILELDVKALRDQLSIIHASMIEDVDAAEIPGYAGIEKAIQNQDSVELSNELKEYDELVLNELSIQNPEQADLNQNVDKAILQEDVMKLRTALSKIGESAISSKRTLPARTKVLRIASSAVAAVFLLMIAGAIFLNQSATSITSDKNFSKFFHSYDGIGNQRGPSEGSNKIIEYGIQKYNLGEFSTALELFEMSIREGNHDETLLMLAGSCALETGDYDKSLRYLDNWDINSPNIDQVDWYRIGCYIKKKDFTSARVILNKILEDTKHPYYSEAKTLLKKIRSDV
jgi:tetratricopeptide (TPR) repeat protein